MTTNAQYWKIVTPWDLRRHELGFDNHFYEVGDETILDGGIYIPSDGELLPATEEEYLEHRAQMRREAAAEAAVEAR